MKVLDLFSGIGGFSLGLESTGYFETIAFCEKDKFCQKVLQKNFPNIPIESEVRNVKGEKYAAEVVTGGFPCQPFSVAGKRKGTEDDRYLWDETIRIVAETKPKWFIGENVEGIINIQNGMVLRQVQTDLEGEGFQVQCLVIPASGIGAWHQRKRTWIIANSNTGLSIRKNKQIQTRGNTITGGSENVSNPNSDLRKRRGAEQQSGANQVWRFCIEKKEQTQHDIRSKTIGCDVILKEKENVLHTISKGLERHRKHNTMEERVFREDTNEITNSNSKGKSWKTWWQTESRICGIPDGVSATLDKNRSNRIKSLGNSIVPQIARELGLAIIKAEQDV